MTEVLDHFRDDTMAPFGFNICILCGKDAKPDDSYCSSDCRSQDMQGSPTMRFTAVPALVSSSKGGRSTASSSSVCSTPPSSANSSPAAALGGDRLLDEENVSAFQLPPSVLGQIKPATKPLYFDYSHPQINPTDSLSMEDDSDMSPSLLTHLYKRAMTRSDSRDSTFSTTSSPTTPTDNLLKMQRSQNQFPSKPRRTSANLLSPSLRPLTIMSGASSFDQSSFAKQKSAASTQPVSGLSPLFNSTRSDTVLKHKEPCGKPGCPSLSHARPQPIKLEFRRPSAPLIRSRLSFSAASSPKTRSNQLNNEQAQDADSENSSPPVDRTRGRGRPRNLSHKASVSRLPFEPTSMVDGTKHKRSESAHVLGVGVCDTFIAKHPRGVLSEEMDTLNLGDSALRSSSSSSSESEVDGSSQSRPPSRGRRDRSSLEPSERGRSNIRDGDAAANRRSRSRHPREVARRY